MTKRNHVVTLRVTEAEHGELMAALQMHRMKVRREAYLDNSDEDSAARKRRLEIIDGVIGRVENRTDKGIIRVIRRLFRS